MWRLIDKPAHKILVLITYAHMALTCVHADASSAARDLNLGLSHHLHLYFMYASSEGSGMSVRMRRLAWTFIACRCNKYQILLTGLYTVKPVLSGHSIIDKTKIFMTNGR